MQPKFIAKTTPSGITISEPVWTVSLTAEELENYNIPNEEFQAAKAEALKLRAMAVEHGSLAPLVVSTVESGMIDFRGPVLLPKYKKDQICFLCGQGSWSYPPIKRGEKKGQNRSTPVRVRMYTLNNTCLCETCFNSNKKDLKALIEDSSLFEFRNYTKEEDFEIKSRVVVEWQIQCPVCQTLFWIYDGKLQVNGTWGNYECPFCHEVTPHETRDQEYRLAPSESLYSYQSPYGEPQYSRHPIQIALPEVQREDPELAELFWEDLVPATPPTIPERSSLRITREGLVPAALEDVDITEEP